MKEQTDIVLFIWYRGQVAGSVALYDLKWHNQSGMLGYWVGTGFEGRGIAHRAVRGMLMYAYYTLMLNRVELRAAVQNEKASSSPAGSAFRQKALSGRLNGSAEIAATKSR